MQLMKIIFVLLIICANMPSFASDHSHARLEVHDHWVREAPPSAKVLAAYLSLHNHTDKTRTILSVTSPQFGRVEIHRTEMKDGMARMMPVSKIILSSHGKVLFEPGGLHLMLFNPKKKYRSGDKIRLTLHLSDKSTFDFTAPVKKGHGKVDHSGHDMDHNSQNMNHESHGMDHDSMNEHKNHSDIKHNH